MSQARAPLGTVATSLTALGIVFGDIGTSPLYTLKTVLELAGNRTDPEAVLGALSLIVWTLTIVTSIKYVAIAMRIGNDGEGGILALMALIGIKRGHRPMIVATGLLGAALIYGDGAITPAISVLSALEGLETATPFLKPYILPLSVVILVGLFLCQPYGTARIGRAFGPIMLLWFFTIGVIGLAALARNPQVLVAVSPLYAISYLLHGGSGAFLVLGGVFLSVTGAEALYADMGHFGPSPIRKAWFWIVFPGLVLSYAGQAAYLLASPGPVEGNIFYRLCPSSLLVPLVILATLATIIASQSIITGAFSMTRQAIQLGWMPRLRILQTSEEGYGQIYVPAVNWLLMAVTICITLGFQKSDNLASAYGIAVSATMLMTTGLLWIAMRDILGWRPLIANLISAALLLVDTAFFSANLVKVAEGGYVPIALALAVYIIMYIWHRGIENVRERIALRITPVEEFFESLPASRVARVPGTAVFLTRFLQGTPPVIAWYVSHSRALQQRVIAITVETLSVPWASEDGRVKVNEESAGFWRVNVKYGFLERPNVPALLSRLKPYGCDVNPADATYFVGHEVAIAREDGTGIPRWMAKVFALLLRNSAHVADAMQLPADQVIEIGRTTAI